MTTSIDNYAALLVVWFCLANSAIAFGGDLTKQFRMQVINPFSRVINRLTKSQEAALYAEVSKKVPVRGDYDVARGLNKSSIRAMLQDVAYSLRHFKFNEFDRRYERQWKQEGRRPSRDLYLRFPRPALTQLHSAVSDHCWTSLYDCLLYLTRVLRYTYTVRRFDVMAGLEAHFNESATAANVARWRADNGDKVDEMLGQLKRRCRELHRSAATNPEPFRSLVERFRWYTSASYFMCWYTMHRMPELAYVGKRCDDLADCLRSAPSGGANLGTRDPRVFGTKTAFSCALFSFCPDPCCPMRSVRSMDMCYDSPMNPCRADNPPGRRQCSVDFENNRNFDALVTSYLNVSCHCPGGHAFNSFFRRCVDVDECDQGLDDCDRQTEACENRYGSYRCVCRFGYRWNASAGECQPRGDVKLYVRVVKKMQQEMKNQTLKQRLVQIEDDLRHHRLDAYLAWLPFNTSRVPVLGELVRSFTAWASSASHLRVPHPLMLCLLGLGLFAFDL